MSLESVLRVIVLLSFALSCRIVAGGEGALEINQACAEGSGCFSGDDAGFPVEVAAPGHYVLTGNLDLPAGTAGVQIQAAAAGTTVDLNGHSIQGPEACSDIPVSDCSGVGVHHGVDGDGVERITLMNGSISGMAGSGARLGDRSRVLRMHLSENRLGGVFVVGSAFLRDISARRNGDNGVRAAAHALVSTVEAEGNQEYGVYVLESSHIRDSTTKSNGSGGFYLWDGSIVESSTARSNEGPGFLLSNNAVARSISALANTTYGITCVSASAVTGSTLAGNTDGPFGPFDTNCVALGANFCNGSTTCP